MVGTYSTAIRQRLSPGVVLLVLLLFLSSGFIFVSPVSAAQLRNRSLRIESAAAGAATRHTLSFSYTTTDQSVGSVVFEYCTGPLFDFACDAPAGVDASQATLSGQTGETGFTIADRQPNRIVLARSPATNPSVSSIYTFDTVTNPTGTQDSFYVRISTYAAEDGSGPLIDFGSVVNATTEGVQLSSEVPPYLKFCVGLTIADDCSTANGNLIELGELRSTAPAGGSSQMMAATNADFGLAIAVYGTTMTSGNHIIPALATPTASAPGNSQFGFNLRANNDPPRGQNPSGGGITHPTAKYNIPNRYAFANGDLVATSPDVTDTRKFTASYVVNVSPRQSPGVYTATLTYICTATF